MSDQNNQVVERPTTPATITLSDGKERVLRYSIGTMKKLKELFGASLFKGGLNDLDEEKLPILIWYGLKHGAPGGDPTLTQDQVEELIDAQMLPYVMSRFLMAFGAKAKNVTAPEAEIPVPAAPIPTVN